MNTLYELCAIRQNHGARLVLDLPELRLRRGGLYTLSGANGAGKSTLLQLLALLRPPASGSLSFAGTPVTTAVLPRLRRRVTLLAQSPYLLRGSVADNVAFGLRIRGVPRGECRERVAAALAEVGLDGFAGRRASALSGGEQQRVALARALVLDPEVLLLDEPCAGLDRACVERIETVLCRRRAGGTTIVLATHDAQQNARLGGCNLHLVDGRLAGMSAPPAVEEHATWLSVLTMQEA
jgi:tungstate transport system ATP-binding protein